MHSRILDIPNPVKTQVCIALAEQHRSDSNSICRDIAERELNLSDVIDQSCHGQHIKSAKGTFLKDKNKIKGRFGEKSMWADRPCTLWVIVISVNRENRDCDVEIAVLIVDSWKAM
jgi:hypothetical protein